MTLGVVGTVTFAVAACGWQLALWRLSPPTKSDSERLEMLNTALFISVITTISYALTASGAFTLETTDGNHLYPQRWVFNSITCSFQLWSWFGRKDVSAALIVAVVIASGTVIDVGRAQGYDMWSVYYASLGVFVYVIFKYYSYKSEFRLKKVFLTLWMIFPAITAYKVFQHGLGWWLYGADILTKIVFELILQLTHKTSCQYFVFKWPI